MYCFRCHARCLLGKEERPRAESERPSCVFPSLLALLSKLIFYQGRTSSASTSNSSLMFAQDVSKLMDMLPPWATRSNKDKDLSASPKKNAKENKPSKEVLRSK